MTPFKATGISADGKTMLFPFGHSPAELDLFVVDGFAVSRNEGRSTA